MLVDIHQHIWTEPLLAVLAARTALPLVRRENGLTVLHCAGEAPFVIDVESETPALRAALVARDGLDLAVVALSSPIGIEALPADSALELIDSHLEGVGALPSQFAAWGPVALDAADADQVDLLRARGCVGVSLPAGALAGPDRLYRLGPLLERAVAHGLPVLVHPGRAPGQRAADVRFGDPVWWPALTGYVAQMQAAWLTFAAFGRRDHPDLVIVFAMLAGCAPLLGERLAARAGTGPDQPDPLTFYDTSSFGPAAVSAMAAFVGEDQLVYGSDRPVIEPVATGREPELRANGARLLSGIGVAA